jgi:hypothetical protein
MDADLPLAADQDAMGSTVCPRFLSCSTPLCPLDQALFDRIHLWGDPVCFYLRVFSKSGVEGLLSTDATGNLIRRIPEVYPDLIGRYAGLKSALKRAAACPAKSFCQRVDSDNG